MSDESPRYVTANNILFFFCLWFGFCLFNYTYHYLLMGWLKVLFGASDWEWSQHWLFLSLPLALISDAFLIRPGIGFIHMCAIIVANAYLQAMLIFPLVRFVQYRFRANRAIQLGLEKTIPGIDTAEMIEDAVEDDVSAKPEQP